MRRIAILGISGAGKSTLARAVGQKLGLPIYHLDAHFWKPNWVMPDDAEWSEKISEMSSGESWIIDGNYTSAYAFVLPKADTIVVLDFSRSLSLFRVLRRIFSHYGKVREDSAPGCQDRLDFGFLKYVYDFPKKKRPQIFRALETFGKDKKIHILKTPKEVQRFLIGAIGAPIPNEEK